MNEGKRVDVIQERIAWLIALSDDRHKEVMRRLEELNHAHARATTHHSTYVPRETFETKIETVQRVTELRNTEVDRHLDAIKKMVYVGVGIVLALQSLLWIFVVLLEKKI